MWSLGLPRCGFLEVSDGDQEKNGGLIQRG